MDHAPLFDIRVSPSFRWGVLALEGRAVLSRYKSCLCAAVCYFYSCLHTWSLCIAASDGLLLWPPYLLFACSVVLCGSLPSAPICDAISSNAHQLFFGSWLWAGIRPVCSIYRKPCTFSLPFACDMGSRVAYVLGYRLRCHTTIASLLHRDPWFFPAHGSCWSKDGTVG